MRLWDNSINFSKRAASTVPVPRLVYILFIALVFSLTLAPAIFAQCANEPPRPIDTYPAGLVAYWNFDKSAGSTYGSNGGTTVGTPSLICSKIGGAYKFNASTASFINTTFVQAAVINYTIISMVNTTSPQSVIINDRGNGSGQSLTLAVGPSCGTTYGTYSCPSLAAAAGLPGFGLDIDNVWIGTVGVGRVDNGAWHMLGGVFNSVSGQGVTPANFKVYVDGAYSGGTNSTTANSPLSPFSGFSTTRIGYHQPWLQYFNGSIDELAVFTTALNASVISQYYNFTQSNFTYFATRPNLSLVGTVLVGSAGFTDPEGNLINYSYSFYLNGTRVSSGNSTSINNLPGAWINISNYTNISVGTWTFEVRATDGLAWSSPINSTSLVIASTPFNLSAFTSADPQGGSSPAFSDLPIYFYANATLPPTNVSLSGAICTIKYHDNTNASMVYNSTSKLFMSSRSYNSSGNYAYNVSCIYGITTQSVSRNVSVAGFTLQVWDSNDPPAGNLTVYPGDMARFYSNFTFSNDTPVSGGVCNITYHDSTKFSMLYNNTTGLFVSNRSYSSYGTYSYNVTCSFGANAFSLSHSIFISGDCKNSPPRPIDTYPAGLVDYWNFDKSPLATYGGNDGTLVGGPSQVCSKIGGAYSFNSNSSSYINTSLLQSGSTQYTIAAMVNTSSAQGVVVNDRDSGAGMSLTLAIGPSCNAALGQYCPGSAAGVPAFGLDSNEIWIGQNGISLVNDNAWHLLAGTFNSTLGQNVNVSNLRLYIDGLSVAGATGVIGAGASPLTGLSGTKIGYHAPWNQYFNGTIDELAIFNRAVTPTEMSEFYNFTQSRFTYFATRPNITFNGSALHGTAAFIDPENDLLNYSYSWYLNGARVSTGNSTSINNPSAAWANLSTYTNISTGNWTFEVWATDGKAWSNPINSTPLHVEIIDTLYVSTSKQSYISCSRILYSVTATDMNDSLVDTETTVSIFDSISALKYSNMFYSGNAGVGIYQGEYDILSGDSTGTWLVQALTCGNVKNKQITVN